MNSTVKAVLLVVVIAACLGFVVFRMMGGKKASGGGGGASSEKDLYCLECKKPYKAKVEDNVFMPLQMGGEKASPKHTCPTCGKQAGVAAIKCASCGELVPSPGMQSMMMGGAGPGAAGMKKPACPKCGKPLTMAATMGSGSGGPAGGPAPAPAK